MNPLFKIKAALMSAAMNKKKNEYFDVVSADLSQLDRNADPLVNNSYFFGGYGMDGSCFTMRLGQRTNGTAEIFVILVMPDGRYLASEKQEYPLDEAPIKVRNIIPARDWNVVYEGTMVDMNDGSKHECTLRFDYIARLPIFYPMRDGDLRGIAESFARRRWNKAFFKSLAGDTGVNNEGSKTKQIHYEQTGRLVGSVTLDGIETQFSYAGIRDRAFGKRDWNYMNVHIWLIAATPQGEVMNFSIVSYPHASNMFCGYCDYDEDRNYALSDYKIISYDHNNGVGPEEMIVDCKFTNGKTYRVKTHRQHDLVTKFDGGNFYFHEAVGDFTFTTIPDLGCEPLPGAKVINAKGTIEMGWNKDSSRWGTYDKDKD